ncbi:MAG TPA: DUF3592 domain-containing protein [Oculatellaceae cyanobacterium]
MLHSSLAKLGPSASIICGIVTFGSIAAIQLFQAQLSTEAEQTTSWASCFGTITETYQEHKGLSFTSELPTYACYDYVVNGKRFTSSQIYHDQLAASTYLPKGERYTKGETVKVYYDQKNPKESVLRTGKEQKSDNAAGFFALYFFGAALFFGGLKRLIFR